MIAARQIAFGKAAGEAPPAYWGLCFTAEEDGSIVAMEAVGSAPAVTLETSFDGEIWEPFYVGETSITLNNGECVYFKAGESGNTAFATSTSVYNKFSLTTGKIAASGDIMSLLNGDVTSDTIPMNYCFAHLFRSCASLTAAPELPAMTLENYCYAYTFRDCTSLTAAPELPATSLATVCYQQMFRGCTSLTTAPKLPATTLADYCYQLMFYGCTSLTAATGIAATTLATGCCLQMFQGCTKLNEIEVAMTVFSYTTNWLSGVSPTGTFRCPTALGTNETITRGVSACPTGWTVINTD